MVRVMLAVVKAPVNKNSMTQDVVTLNQVVQSAVGTSKKKFDIC